MLLPIPLKPADSSNLSINRLEEVAGFRGIGSWIQEAAGYDINNIIDKIHKRKFQNRHF